MMDKEKKREGGSWIDICEKYDVSKSRRGVGGQVEGRAQRLPPWGSGRLESELRRLGI